MLHITTHAHKRGDAQLLIRFKDALISLKKAEEKEKIEKV